MMAFPTGFLLLRSKLPGLARYLARLGSWAPSGFGVHPELAPSDYEGPKRLAQTANEDFDIRYLIYPTSPNLPETYSFKSGEVYVTFLVLYSTS